MFKNYLKIAWRNLLRNKSFSLLNIMGLALGLAVTALILIWINFELGVDQYHTNRDRIYEVYNKYPLDGELWTWNSTPKVMGPVIQSEYPEVEAVTRFFYDTPFLFSKDDQRVKSTGTIVDPDFLKMFDFPLLEGTRETVLQGVNSVVVTETFAKKLFGNTSVVGKTVKVNNSDNIMITGVLQDLPANTGFNFEFLMPWEYLKQKGWHDENWGNNSVGTYVMLKKGTDYDAFSKKIANLRERHDKESPDMETFLYPWSRYWLHSEFVNGKESGGRIVLIRMFGIIAGIILIIACINFMNLSTARSEKRAKEVGIRKTVGAKKWALIGQFLGESILISFLAALLGLVVVLVSLQPFSDLVQKPLSLDFSDSWVWLSTLGVTLFTGVLAGSYPALYLSGFQPAAVLKGTFRKMESPVTPRKVLVVFQFAVAIILITSTIIVGQQLNKVQDRQSGYTQNNLVYTRMEGDMEKNYTRIKEALLTSGIAASVTKTNSPVTSSESNGMNFEWKGRPEDDKSLVYRFIADDDVVRTMGLELVAGRDLDLDQYPTDSTAALLTESAVELMDFQEPIGESFRDNGIDWRVVGVVKDFLMRSPFQRTDPIAIMGAKAWFDVIHIKFDESLETAEALAKTEAIFRRYNSEYPFEYTFVDQAYAQKFEDQQRTGQLVSLFTLFTIFISCLGLFGLASYMAENRIKEIGIRKVLGASVRSIAGLLSKDFLKLVLISLVIAVPVSWYFMSEWLSDFAYRIDISWWSFALAGILALAVALLTVSSQAIRAAVRNPVKSLRTE